MQAVKVCARVKAGDRVVVITDKKTEEATAYVVNAIKNVTDDLQIFEMREAPKKVTPEILKAIQQSSATFVCAEYLHGEMSDFWRPIGDVVRRYDTKILVMVDLTKQLLEQGMNADYDKIREFSHKIYELVKDARKIKVVTEKGCDFTVGLGHRWAILDGFPAKGKWVNLPDGEVLTCPKDFNGVVVVDGSIEDNAQGTKFGPALLRMRPLTVEVKDGRAVEGSLDCSNAELRDFVLNKIFHGDNNGNRVGEFAFGTNIFLKELCGNLTQDEKFPSVHIAFGDPHGHLTGAEWTSNIHHDMLILEPTVYVDDKVIMKEGEYSF